MVSQVAIIGGSVAGLGAAIGLAVHGAPPAHRLLESPDVVLDDPEVVEHARNTQRILASKATRKIGPDDDELAAILAGARTQ